MTYKLVILDRDGVINEPSSTGGYIHREQDFHIYKDVKPFLDNLFNRGIKIAIATNQRGIALNLYSMNDVQALHKSFLELCGFKSDKIPIYCCPHDLDECDCRKPKPGLLKLCLEESGVEVRDAVFIGDQETDRLAAKSIDIDFIKISRSKDVPLSSTSEASTLTECFGFIV